MHRYEACILLGTAFLLLSTQFKCVQSLKEDGLAVTPVMGWNSWNTFGTYIDEELIKTTADLLLELGLADVGYTTLSLDDGWSSNRTKDGLLIGSISKFPSGMKAIGDYIHSKGLKFGIYSDAGPLTCAGWPGSRGYEEIDAQTFASFGVDYLKYDNCFAPEEDWIIDRYTAMSRALKKTDRPIVYSLCDWGVLDPWLGWAKNISHSWRTTQDIAPNWNSILANLDSSIGLAQFAGPGGWNDADMLEIGVGNSLTHNQERAHFALWSLLKSPLLIGADLRIITPDSLNILKAKEIIAMNQDALGVAGELVWKQGPKEIYAAPLAGGSRGLVFLNRHCGGTNQYPTVNMTVHWSEIGLPDGMEAWVRDLWRQIDLPRTYNSSFTASVELHDGAAFKVTPVSLDLKKDHKMIALLDEWRPWKGNPSFVVHSEDLGELSKRNVSMELPRDEYAYLLSVSK